MKIYYTGGTIGDAYIILCKLYSIAKQGKILCRHHTKYEELEPVIKEVYSLLPSISVEFMEHKNPAVEINGAFYFSNSETERDEYNFETEYYPEFELPEIDHFNLPPAYEALQIEAGGHRDRSLYAEAVGKILNDSKLPIILIGKTEKLSMEFQSTIDLREKTNIKEVVKVIKNSKHFYGLVGFLGFVALSQKVPATIFAHSRLDKGALYNRIEMVDEWKKFLVKK